jgi:hypothetical protein
MIYLIVSLVAGLFFLISGKVKFGKTLYLEGTKARIAGLIFLAPLGLMLMMLVVGVILETTGIITDSKTFEQVFGSFAQSLVANGFVIGLAYINFYSVSRETKERGGCLTYWLAYALLLIYFSLTFFSNAQWIKIASTGIIIFQITFLIGIWFWKKWAVFGYAIVTIISPIIAFLDAAPFSRVLIILILSLSLVLELYLVVKPKWQFFE